MSGPAAISAWARMENAACARRLAAMAALLDARLSADGSADREQWCGQLVGSDRRDRRRPGGLRRPGLSAAPGGPGVARAPATVAQVFAAGVISYRVVAAIVARTALVKDPDARAKIDTELAAHVTGWGAMSVARTERAVDYWVDRYDPYALRR